MTVGGLRGPPKRPFLAIFGHIWPWVALPASNWLNTGWTRLNIVAHIWGAHWDPFAPTKMTLEGLRGPLKQPYFSHIWQYLAIFGHSGLPFPHGAIFDVSKGVHPAPQMWDTMFNLVQAVPNQFEIARTAYWQIWPNMTKNGHFGGLLGPPGPFGRVQRDPIGPSKCEISFSILFIQYPTHLGQLGPPMGIYGQIWLKMAVLGAFQGPQGHFWWTHKGLAQMGPLQTKFLTQMCPLNFWDLNQITLIYTLLLQIQLCREHALFEGHFWPKFCDRGH